jgi:hypothetical protein
LVAQLASEFNLEVELKNIILVADRFFEFLHSQGQFRTSAVVTAMSALPQIALQNSKNGFQRFLREKSNQAIIADRRTRSPR